jgi:hypothetical protein
MVVFEDTPGEIGIAVFQGADRGPNVLLNASAEAEDHLPEFVELALQML